MSSLAAARADNFYFKNDFDPTKPNRPKKPDHLKKDYSTIRYLIKLDLRSCFISNVLSAKKCLQKVKDLMLGKNKVITSYFYIILVGYFHTTKIWEF